MGQGFENGVEGGGVPDLGAVDMEIEAEERAYFAENSSVVRDPEVPDPEALVKIDPVVRFERQAVKFRAPPDVGDQGVFPVQETKVPVAAVDPGHLAVHVESETAGVSDRMIFGAGVRVGDFPDLVVFVEAEKKGPVPDRQIPGHVRSSFTSLAGWRVESTTFLRSGSCRQSFSHRSAARPSVRRLSGF